MASSPRKARKAPLPSTAIVGANVYRLRVLRLPKLSQDGLANLSGVSVETIANDPRTPELVTVELMNWRDGAQLRRYASARLPLKRDAVAGL
jgi:hypothetical protein